MIKVGHEVFGNGAVGMEILGDEIDELSSLRVTGYGDSGTVANALFQASPWLPQDGSNLGFSGG